MKMSPIIIALVVLVSVFAITRTTQDSNKLFATPIENTDVAQASNSLSFREIDRQIYADQLGLPSNASWDEVNNAIVNQEYPTR